MTAVRIRLSPYVSQLVDEVSGLSGQTKTATVERLLFVVESLARHSKLTEAFGLDVIEAAALINARGLGAKHLDPVHQAGGEHVSIDIAMLERSAKTKTGFAGVSATGTSFRAIVPDVEQGGGSRYLPSRPTAVQAAIDRFEYFKRYNIPYGNLGWHVADLKAKYPDWTDEQCLERLELFLSDGNTFGMKNPVTMDEVQHALSRYRKQGAEREPEVVDEPEVVEEPIPPRLPAPPSAPHRVTKPLVSVPDVVHCAVCKKEIEEGEPFGPHGKTDYVHVSCLA